MNWITLIFFLFLVTPILAEDLKILELQLEVNQLKQQLKECNFERGKSQIEAGSLRQGLSGAGYRELKAEEEKLKAEIEEAKKARK